MIKKIMTLAAIFMLCVMGTQAQVLKGADLEKYAKQRYGDRWVDAATNLASSLVLDKNQSLTYQEVIEAPGKTKSQLYVALNYWATATFKNKQAITLNDKDAGCIIISSTLKDIAEHTGTINRVSNIITNQVNVNKNPAQISSNQKIQLNPQANTTNKKNARRTKKNKKNSNNI